LSDRFYTPTLIRPDNERCAALWVAAVGLLAWSALDVGQRTMSDEFDGLNATEKAGIGTELNRCRALATKIANELRNKRPEHFVDKLSLADVHTSLERAADVLSTVKGSQARGRQRRR
jgi:hypothetical protein